MYVLSAELTVLLRFKVAFMGLKESSQFWQPGLSYENFPCILNSPQMEKWAHSCTRIPRTGATVGRQSWCYITALFFSPLLPHTRWRDVRVILPHPPLHSWVVNPSNPASGGEQTIFVHFFSYQIRRH